MTAFRIEPSREGMALRVIHGPGDKLAEAIIQAEPDGRVCLVPVNWTDPPPPLTGTLRWFHGVDDVRSFLGIEDRAPS